MDHYSRLYDDPKSPLTPLTPLGTGGGNVFNYQFGGDNSLDQQIDEALRTTPRRPAQHETCSTEFLKLRNVFEKQKQQQHHHQMQQLQQHSAPIMHCNRNVKQKLHRQQKQQPQKAKPKSLYLEVPSRSQYARQQQQAPAARQKATITTYRQASPIQPKILSPRLATVLTQNDMWKYGGLFQREEIDLEVFRTLTYRDLLSLGIRSAEDIPKILRAVHTAHEHC